MSTHKHDQKLGCLPKSTWNHKYLSEGEIMSLRINRNLAYDAGQYTMEIPPVCTARWDREAWQNWVVFNNPKLTGFLPYTKP